MDRRPKLPIGAALLLLAAMVACGAPPQTEAVAAAAPPDPAVVARVNGEAVERWEVEAAVREISLANLHPIPEAERDALFRAVLERIIGHHVAAQLARARNLAVSETAVDADVAGMRAEFADDRAFDEALATFNLSREQLRRQRRLSLEVAQLVRVAIAPTIDVTPAEVNAYYRDNPERFQRPEMIRVRHILVRTAPDATPEQQATGRLNAAGILDQLRGGADFAQLARQRSEDSRSAPDGGALGEVARGELHPRFDESAFALQPGDVSGLVETPLGFHIIKVDGRQAASTSTLEEVAADIKALLTERAEQEQLAALVADARKAARIEMYP